MHGLLWIIDVPWSSWLDLAMTSWQLRGVVHGLYMDYTWIIHGLYMDYTWNTYRLYIYTHTVSHRLHLDYRWIIYGLQMNYNMDH